MRRSPATDVIFVVGAARSGSTLLAQALGTHPDCFAAGEICNVWRHWLARGICSCGEQVGACELWAPALTGALAEHGLGSPAEAEQLRLSVARTRYEVMSRLPGQRTRRTSEWDAYTELLASVHRALRAATGCTTIVDTSKKPVDAAAARAGGNTYLVHLVRDPRAVAASEKRPHPANLPAQELPFVRNVVRSAIDWSWLNVLAANLVRRAGTRTATTLSYAALVGDIRTQLDAICAAAGLADFDWPITDGRANFATGHIVNGNPARFNTGWVAIRDTSDPRASLSPLERILTSVITFPATRLLNSRF